MLTAGATRITAISRSGVRDSLIFGPSCFLGPLIIIRSAPVRVLTGISCRACRACISLRSSWACHRGSYWGRGAPGHK